MRDKFIVVIGVGVSKFLQLLFGLFLSYKYNYGALTTFVLVMTLSAAMSSIISLGSSPQIIRAGAHPNPLQHISAIIGTAILLIGITLFLLICYILIGEYNFQIDDFTKWDYLFSSALVLVSFCLYSIIQSYLSYSQKYLKLGILTIKIYLITFAIPVFLSFFDIGVRNVILIYSLIFLISTLLVFFRHIKYEFEFLIFSWDSFLNIPSFFKVAMFGFFTMVSLYLSVKYVNNIFDEQTAAIYSISFQFFQIGSFLPGILGIIIIPQLVRNGGSGSGIVKAYVLIAIFWLLFCGLIFYPLFKVYSLKLEIDLIITFFIMQFAVILSAIQAYFNQKYVALGKFNLLAFNASLWGGGLLFFQSFLPKIIYFSPVSLIMAYVISLFVFFLAGIFQSKFRVT